MLSLVGVLVALFFIIAIVRLQNRFIDFGVALILAALIVGVFSLDRIGAMDIAKAIVEASIYSFKSHQIVTQTFKLALFMTLIFVLAKAMQDTGAIGSLIKSLRSIFARGGTLGVIPAVYGMMPVIGGALLSAPMIDEEGNRFELDKDQKNFLNMWFRHIWLSLYPLQSAMVIICSKSFSNISVFELIRLNIPAFAVYIFIGILILKRMTKKVGPAGAAPQRNYAGLVYLLPPTLPLIFYTLMAPVGISQIEAFTVGVVFSTVLVFYLTGTIPSVAFRIVRKGLNFRIALTIFGIMIFREMFEVSGANAEVARLALMLNLPAGWMLVVTPMICAILTGYSIGAIALSYFLIQPVFTTVGTDIVTITSIIYISAQVGYLISPIHMCNLLSSEYLNTDVTRIYRWYLPAVICWLAAHLVYINYIHGM